MRFGAFLFTECRNLDDDARAIEETLRQAQLAEELGFDAVWLAEHHFDGICAYVDPMTFSAALAVATKRILLGYAVIQTSLHHPIRLAEQLALIDHLSRGRLICGLGKGSLFSTYEYAAFEVDPGSAQARLDEVESILVKCWTGQNVEHRGAFWNFQIPMLRPRPFSQPHPIIIRGVASEGSAISEAKKGRPFLLPTLGAHALKRRLDLIRQTMLEAGHDKQCDVAIRQSWVWQNIVVADSDREAKEIAMSAARSAAAYRARLSPDFLAHSRRLDEKPNPDGLIFGSPDSVVEQLSAFQDTDIGGVILRFRLGPMTYEATTRSMKLFADLVMPRLRRLNRKSQ